MLVLVLGDERDPDAARAARRARRRPQQAGEDEQQRALAAAVGADERHRLPGAGSPASSGRGRRWCRSARTRRGPTTVAGTIDRRRRGLSIRGGHSTILRMLLICRLAAAGLAVVAGRRHASPATPAATTTRRSSSPRRRSGPTSSTSVDCGDHFDGRDADPGRRRRPLLRAVDARPRARSTTPPSSSPTAAASRSSSTTRSTPSPTTATPVLTRVRPRRRRRRSAPLVRPDARRRRRCRRSATRSSPPAPTSRPIDAVRRRRSTAELEELDAELDRDPRPSCPPDRRLLVTNHDALGYFADRYDFEILGTRAARVVDAGRGLPRRARGARDDDRGRRRAGDLRRGAGVRPTTRRRSPTASASTS